MRRPRAAARVQEHVGRVNVDAVAVADHRLDLADRVRVAECVRHGVEELEVRAVLVLDERHDLGVIVFFEQKGLRLQRDERDVDVVVATRTMRQKRCPGAPH